MNCISCKKYQEEIIINYKNKQPFKKCLSCRSKYFSEPKPTLKNIKNQNEIKLNFLYILNDNILIYIIDEHNMISYSVIDNDKFSFYSSLNEFKILLSQKDFFINNKLLECQYIDISKKDKMINLYFKKYLFEN